MSYVGYIWLLLCYAQYARSSLTDEYEVYSTFITSRRDMFLPIEIGIDKFSGCTCRGTRDRRHIVCFGGYACKVFPKMKCQSEALRVRTTIISSINENELDSLFYLKTLEIEANHHLTFLKAGIFKNLTNLEQLSISYNTQLKSIDENLFIGLNKLKNLTMVNNGFTNLLDLTVSLQPKFLPSLRRLDLSENIFDSISLDAFSHMKGTGLNSLKISLCQIENIHPRSFLPLKKLQELIIGENDIRDTSTIECFLREMTDNNINLLYLDISSMGFKTKFLPKKLLHAISESTIKRLKLTQNKFEMISDSSFPKMEKIEVLDLRKVFAVSIGPNAFDPEKFPNLKALFLSGNYLPGIHSKHLSAQLKLLDISYNSGNPSSPVYFEIARGTFVESGNLQVLNLSYNRIKAISDYTFKGLHQLKVLNMENGTIFHIGPGTFLATQKLEILNLANNPITLSENLTSDQFQGLNALKVLILSNCGIRYLYNDNNMFDVMPNITHLILKNNLIMNIEDKTFEHLKNLNVLDLSGNLLIAWWTPIFLSSGIKPQKLLLGNNKITHFSVGMLKDMNYLLSNGSEFEMDLMDNVFICDCSSMFTAYMWLETNGSAVLKEYFKNSDFQCSSPDLWKNNRVVEYFVSIKSLQCVAYERISNVMVLIWTLPSFIVIIAILVSSFMIYKYRYYIRYWIFLAKIALGRTLRPWSGEKRICIHKEHKYDAFVSYCNDDRELVLKIISQLETKPPHFRLCIFERDFEIGSFISDSIMSGINDSKFVVLIISNNFAKSHWCRWETQLAEYHRFFLEDGSCCDPLVLIRVGDLEQKYLTPTLKYLLNTKIYLEWNPESDEFWTKFRRLLSKDK